MLSVGIVGGSGYTGSELIRLLITHPEKVDLACVTSRSLAGQYVSKIHPNLRGLVDLKFAELDVEKVTDEVSIVFLGLPHKAAMEFVPRFLERGVKVIDFSADYRLKSVHVYERYYQEHTSPHLLKEAVYGLPELHRAEIKDAFLVANPGCYPTGAILAALPALKAGVAQPENVIVDSKSGISGAGLPGMPPLGKQPSSDFGLRTGHGMWEGGFGTSFSTFFRGNGLFPPGTNALITVYLLELQEKR